MAGKAKFDKDAAFRSIIGRGDSEDEGSMAQQAGEVAARTVPQKGNEKEETQSGSKDNQVQRSYWLDKDIDKALKRKALEEEKTLTNTINEVLRKGLSRYL